jgi:uncharacterized membrane protein required for colicin V production
MNLVDLGIILVIGLGILIGWRNGLIGPLLAEATFLLTFWIISTHPGLIALVPSGVPRPLAPFVLPIGLGLLVGIVGRVVLQSLFRLPLTRSLDKLLGAAVNGGLAFVIVYVDPLVKASTVQSSQVTAMQMLLAENPQAASFVPSGELSKLATVATIRPFPLSQLGQYARVIDYYQRTLRPQLTSSQLAPVVFRFGARIPLLGRTAPRLGP